MSKIDISLPVGLADTVYIIKSPCYVSGWKYHVEAEKIVEVNRKFDRNGRDIEWGFINEQDALEKAESKNKNAKRHDL